MVEKTTIDQARNKINEQILDHYLFLDDDGNFKHPPSTDDELHEFIQIALKLNIPRKRIDPDHKAPFELVADLFFERVKNALGFANRSGGKTTDIAVLNFLDMIFKKKCEIASAGAVLDQANRCYRYFCQFLDMPWFRNFCINYEHTVGRPFILKSIQSWTELANGSTQEILTGTEKGLRSPHPHKARIDEIDLIPWSVLQTGLSMAKSSDTIRGQNCFTSTRQLERGPMQRLLDEAAKKGIEVYEWNVWEIIERCTRRCVDDIKHGSCPIFKFCKGKAHSCAGFYKIDDFIDKVKVLDEDTWDIEWLNKKPARHKLVYSVYSTVKHIMTPDRLFAMTGFRFPQMDWWRLSAIDFGASPGHPFVYGKICVLPNNAWMLFYEYSAEQRLMRDHARVIKSSPFWTPGEMCYADHAAQDRIELRGLGIRTQPANKSVLMGIDHVKGLLEGSLPYLEPMLYIWYDCPLSISEFSSYRWPIRPDGSVDRSGLPLKVNDNAMDMLRYALYSSKTRVFQRYRATTIVGI